VTYEEASVPAEKHLQSGQIVVNRRFHQLPGRNTDPKAQYQVNGCNGDLSLVGSRDPRASPAISSSGWRCAPYSAF
jgi:hypothetical protein